MRVYDFDKTIFYPDCTYLFIKWCVRRYPSLIYKYLPKFTLRCVLYKLKILRKHEIEEDMFEFIRYIPDIDKEIEMFWDAKEGNISEWYLKQKRSDDLVISASPEFIIKPIARRLNINYIATELDMNTLKIIGRSCYGRQKVKAILDSGIFLNNNVEEFYSDSLSDTPLALCAEKAFLVKEKATEPVPWPELTPEIKKKIMVAIKEDMSEEDRQN